MVLVDLENANNLTIDDWKYCLEFGAVLVVKSSTANIKIPFNLGPIYVLENNFGIKDSADIDLTLIVGYTL